MWNEVGNELRLDSLRRRLVLAAGVFLGNPLGLRHAGPGPPLTRGQRVADQLCMVRSMVSDNNNHPQAMRCLNTGKIFAGRPTLGAWVSYALGTENQNLPAFIVLRDPEGYNGGGTTLWENGWLPAQFAG